ncbi:hypothetical protein AI22_11045 [Pseudomonas aeruginosa YL84]|nr:hypothetical protein AI22_11045 [Pseudomonas aeruginosa YL84]
MIIGRERLTGSTAREELDAPRTVPSGDLLNLSELYAFGDELRPIILLIGVLAVEINIVSSAYADTGLEQARGEPASPTEKVNGVNLVHRYGLLAEDILTGSNAKIEVDH